MKFADIQTIFKKGLQSVVELINSLYAQITELKNKVSELETKNKELVEQKAKDIKAATYQWYPLQIKL